MEQGFKEKKYIFARAPIGEAVFRLALPTIIGQVILVIYNMADTFFVSLTGSDAKITAVTVCMPAFMFLSAIANLFGIGACSTMARFLGKNKASEARSASSFAFYGCLSVTLLYSLGAYVFAGWFVDLLGGANPLVHKEAVTYLLVTVVAGGAATSIGSLFSHILRAQGWSAQASAGIILGGVLNTILDPIFMFRILPSGQEILGAALATAISNLATVLFFSYILHINRFSLIFSMRPSKASPEIIRDVFKTGLPACIMTLCENISYAVLDRLMYYSGTQMQAGLGVAKKVNMLAHCIARGMSQGVLPLIGYNYAAKDFKRMRRAFHVSSLSSIIMATACMLIAHAFSTNLVAIFIQHGSPSQQYGAVFLRILSLGGPFSAFAYSIISFFQAVGKGYRSFLLALLRKGLIDIPIMFLLKDLIPIYGIVWATPIADVICCMAAMALISMFMKTHPENQGEKELKPC